MRQRVIDVKFTYWKAVDALAHGHIAAAKLHRDELIMLGAPSYFIHDIQGAIARRR